MSTPGPGVLHDRVAIVTGGTRGIGLGIAAELGAAGATVYLTGRLSSESHAEGSAQAAAAAVTAGGGVGIGVCCDHTDDLQVQALFARVAADQDGRLDLLVNCCGTMPANPQELGAAVQPFWVAGPEMWEMWCDVGLRSHYVASVHAARMMVARSAGLIVNISSAAAEQYMFSVSYGVAKCALDRFTADAAHELSGHGVTVLSLWPGGVRTEKTVTYVEAGLDLGEAESPRFSGRAIVALATDPDVARRSGSAVYAATLGREYGFTDVDGSQPGLPTYGGMLAQPAA